LTDFHYKQKKRLDNQ